MDKKRQKPKKNTYEGLRSRNSVQVDYNAEEIE